MKYTIKDIIKSFDIVDWCMVTFIIVLYITAHCYAHQYDSPHLVTGVMIGAPMGALAMGLGMSAREHKEAAERSMSHTPSLTAY